MSERLDVYLTSDEPEGGWCTFRLMVGEHEVANTLHRPELPWMAFQTMICEMVVEPYADE